MGQIVPAEPDHAEGIGEIRSRGWRETYRDPLPEEDIEATTAEFCEPDRIEREIREPEGWDGWLVALSGEGVVGAGGGGTTDPGVGEVFVRFVDPERQRAGIDSRLLRSITKPRGEASVTVR